jgi:hypothetical protein
MTRIWTIMGILGLLAGPEFPASAQPAPRGIPRPLPSHPGNIFLAGEEVSVPLPGVTNAPWRALDYEGRVVATGEVRAARAELGRLPVGYYEVFCGGDGLSNRTTLGVIAPLKAPTPLSSPVGIDAAAAWFFGKDAMAAPANLCALAGMNRVRDRLSWPELEPKRGEWTPYTRYDDSIATQNAAGLKILEVNHATAAWANTNSMRFPLDLRDAYNFNKELARRWSGKVEAIEPWNEADIVEFGGHNGSEMASLQKAAYFGIRAGSTNVLACMNVFAIRRAATLKNFSENEAWPYFDTFNVHHYESLQNYPSLYADYRAVSGGRPLWVSECSVHVRWEGDPKFKELSSENLRLQSERVTKTYTLGLYQGVRALFYFVLPHYTERDLQYGLLHEDLTPRPGYLALAAVGRLLADAKPLGRVPLRDNDGQIYYFEAKPDGQPADVAVIWTQTELNLPLPAAPIACYDHLGRVRPVGEGNNLLVNSFPVFVVFPPNTHPKLTPPPKPAKYLPGEPCPIVLQALKPEDVVFKESAYRVPPGKPYELPVYAYNFGSGNAAGKLSVTAPSPWRATIAEDLTIAPGERKPLTLTLTNTGTNSWKDASVRITGDFGPQGRALLSLRFVPQPEVTATNQPAGGK